MLLVLFVALISLKINMTGVSLKTTMTGFGILDSCTDPDGMNNYVRGTTPLTHLLGSTESKTDFCINGSKVMEFYCQYTYGYNLVVIKSSPIDCGRGDKCENGACYIARTCTDSDGGKNVYVKGTTTEMDSNGNILDKSTDRCKDALNVWEYYCAGGTLAIKSIICPSGYRCSDGRCIKSG